MARSIDDAFAELEELRRQYPNLLDIGDDTGEVYRPQEWITDAELALGVQFPPSYVRFLVRHGGGEIGGVEVCSVYGPREPGVVAPGDVVHATIGEWRHSKSPRHLVLIMDDEGDVKYFLDTSVRSADGECPVVKWEIEAPDDYKLHAENFVEFLVLKMKWLGPYW